MFWGENWRFLRLASSVFARKKTEIGFRFPVAVSCSKNQGGLRGGARFRRRPSVRRRVRQNPSPVSRTKPSRPTTANQLTVWVKLLRSKVFLYAMTSIILSMLQAMISIIHSPTACFVGPWKRDGQTDSLCQAPSKQGVLICHREHHSLNASGHDQHNSLAN